MIGRSIENGIVDRIAHHQVRTTDELVVGDVAQMEASAPTVRGDHCWVLVIIVASHPNADAIVGDHSIGQRYMLSGDGIDAVQTHVHQRRRRPTAELGRAAMYRRQDGNRFHKQIVHVCCCWRSDHTK